MMNFSSIRPTDGIMNSMAKVFKIIAVTFLVFVVAFYSYDLYQHGKKKKFLGWFSAAAFVILQFPISFRLIYLHLSHWYQPRVQKYIVRIVWMVPIYSVESWLALRFRSLALHIETMRECYEAYAIFNFLYFLIALLGEEATLISILKEKPDERGFHPWPMNLILSPWLMGHELLSKCKVGVLQYVVLKNLSALLTFVLESCGVYDEGRIRFDRGYLYVCLINNISQLWALYCLILFYLATKEELVPWRPVGKFLCVKMVVFFTWWQSVALDFYFASTSSFPHRSGYGKWTRYQVSKGVQDYAICVEMLIAAVAFSSAFTHMDFVTYNAKIKEDDPDPTHQEHKHPILAAFMQSSLPDDVITDIRRVAKGLDLTSVHDHGSYFHPSIAQALGMGVVRKAFHEKSKDSYEDVVNANSASNTFEKRTGPAGDEGEQGDGHIISTGVVPISGLRVHDDGVMGAGKSSNILGASIFGRLASRPSVTRLQAAGDEAVASGSAVSSTTAWGSVVRLLSSSDDVRSRPVAESTKGVVEVGVGVSMSADIDSDGGSVSGGRVASVAEVEEVGSAVLMVASAHSHGNDALDEMEEVDILL